MSPVSSINTICPHCETAVYISDKEQSHREHRLEIPNARGVVTLYTAFAVCPNPECYKFILGASLQHDLSGENLGKWSLIPPPNAKTFPSYIPAAILADYKEAALIKDLSPKASATLSRRCLQGVLRDFWKVKPSQLVNEIEQIKDKVDSLTWQAIDSVRKLGNIGAHMEKEVGLIVDVDPSEAGLLLELLETLFREWYIALEEKNARLTALIKAADSKNPPAKNTP